MPAQHPAPGETWLSRLSPHTHRAQVTKVDPVTFGAEPRVKFFYTGAVPPGTNPRQDRLLVEFLAEFRHAEATT